MQATSNRRRFIAGAVCPRCGQVDRIVVDPDADRRDCVACGFSEPRPTEPSPVALPTRVTRPAARRIETPAEPVTIVDSRSGGAQSES